MASTQSEYYLKNIGILNIEDNDWTWFVHGADRVAKIRPKNYQQPKNITTSPSVLNDTLEAAFYLYDHLGNTRIVYTPNIQCPEFMEYTIDFAADYYPYGKTLRLHETPPGEKFLTTQHERDAETGLDYRGARFYDSDIAKFLSLDPLAADYPSWSDYNYVMGNPIRLIDADGKEVILPEWEQWVLATYNPVILAHKMNELYGNDGTWIGQFQERLAETASGQIMVESVVGLVEAYADNPDLIVQELMMPGTGSAQIIGEGMLHTLDKAFTEGDPKAWADIAVAVALWRTGNIKGNSKMKSNGGGTVVEAESGSTGPSDASGRKVIYEGKTQSGGKRVVVRKGEKTYDITEQRVKEYKKNPRNPDSRYGDAVNFKKQGVPEGSSRLTGPRSGKGHKRTPTQNELDLLN